MQVKIDIEKYRKDKNSNYWDLPSWGHPISQGIMPLFLKHQKRLHPIGTAFFISKKIFFIASALHNIEEAVKLEMGNNFEKYLANRNNGNFDLKRVGLSVLHQRFKEDGRVEIAIWPLEFTDGAPPTDIVFGFPKFTQGIKCLSFPLSFDLPKRDERLWSIGYTEFKWPKNGIPLFDIRSNKFDWQQEYSHKLRVVEGKAKRVFTQKFASGYIEGSSFTINVEIYHGQSGGPVMTPEGFVKGINSAGASQFFAKPRSIISLLYPLLFTPIRFGAQIKELRLDGEKTVLQLISTGHIRSDGSEEHLHIDLDNPKGPAAGGRIPKEMKPYVHDDFASFQKGLPPTTVTGPINKLKRIEPPWD